jgi:hypothetical protein
MPLLGIIGIVFGIISLICWIMVIVKIFQEGSIGLGILAIICPLFAFIYGWVKVNEYGINNIMLVWTLCIVVNLGVRVGLATMMRGH